MSNPCEFTEYAENKELFREWYNASDAYIDTLSPYNRRTWLAYTIFRTVGVNEYLRHKRIPPDSWNVGSSNYFNFNQAFRPQLKAHYKTFNNIPENIPEDLKPKFINEAIEALRSIISNAPKTTTPFLVFRALRQKYDPDYISGFISTGTNMKNLRMYMTPEGEYMCIHVPIGTPCIIGNGDLCEIFFSDNIKLKPTKALGIPEVELYLEIVQAGGKRKYTRRRSKIKVKKA